MKSAALLWRACAHRLESRALVKAACSPRSLRLLTWHFHEEVSKPQSDQVQQSRRCSPQASALAENGNLSGDGRLCSMRVQQSRRASSLAVNLDVPPQGDKALLHVLRCEVEHLTKRSLDITPRKPPKPWQLVKDEPGEMEMQLNRIYGLEDISLCCVLQLVRKEYQRKPEVGEDPESRMKMLQLTISITKGGTSSVLKVRCECYRDGFAVHQVDLEDEEQSAYLPYFSNAKENLVNNFQVFLYERGLNGDFAGYMVKHLDRKRLLKSVDVIEKLSKFLESDSSSQLSGD